jgi:phosphoenolpyruvate-protein phosphotransferase
MRIPTELGEDILSRRLLGLPAAPGIAFGPAFQYFRQKVIAHRQPGTDTQIELQKLKFALEQAQADLDAVIQRAESQMGKKEIEILQAQKFILQDPELHQRVKQLLSEEKISAAYAWQESIRQYVKTLQQMDDPYLAERAADVEDVGQRMLRLLTGQSVQPIHLKAPSIIVADELSPSDTVLFDRSKLLGFCTQAGGPTSHVAILSKALGVPCVVGLGSELSPFLNDAFLIIDGNSGEVLVEPAARTLSIYQSLSNEQANLRQQAFEDARLPAETADGKTIQVVANICSYEDALEATLYGAEGVGLMRTEFLFLDRENAPDEAEQVETYESIFKVFGESKPIVVRTLDIGGDKPAPYLHISPEKNPFLGMRGTRLTLRFQELFECQLRALLIAGTGYDLRIMFPMVSGLTELNLARACLKRARSTLAKQGKTYCKRPQVGIMVEVPSAALMANQLAHHVDFFSIGTNDLSQYTLAADRTNAEVAHLADAFHPAVLSLISRVIEAAHNLGKWVGLCGELAGDPLATPVLLGMGLDEFSASPKSIPFVKQSIRRFTLAEGRGIAEEVIELEDAKQVREYLIKRATKKDA